MRDQRRDVRKLGGLRFQEFLPRWRIEKQVADGDRGSRRQPGFFDFEDLAAIDFDYGSRVLVRRAGLQVQAGDRSNRRQRLAAKSQSGHAEQVFGILDFGSSVTLEGQQGVVTNHAASVVGDLDELLAAGFDLNLDAGGTGVERIFQKFLDHGGGALHDFAGGDFVGNGFGKNVDLTHDEMRSLSALGISAAGSRCAHARKTPQLRSPRSCLQRIRKERGCVPWLTVSGKFRRWEMTKQRQATRSHG